MKSIILAAAVVVTLATPVSAKVCGGASWYSLPGNRTANGERMNPSAFTAAHKTLKFGTRLAVTNMRNGKTVIVRINDRGPFIRGRVLDLSKAAAKQIGMISSGHAQVCFRDGGKVAKTKRLPKKKTIVDFFKNS